MGFTRILIRSGQDSVGKNTLSYTKKFSYFMFGFYKNLYFDKCFSLRFLCFIYYPPFSEEYRVFPVDFEYAFNETYNTNLVILTGYETDDFPLDEKLTIEGGYVTFMYTIKTSGNMLQINAKFDVRNPLIPAYHYGNLKFFMESVASKLSEPVILKKDSNNRRDLSIVGEN